MSIVEHDYGEQLEPYRGELYAHCYRMLGSVQDTEDAVQETLLKAWRGLHRFEGRSSLRTWLYTIATNVCLRMIERRPTRVLPIDYGPPADPHGVIGPPLVESTWIEPFPDARLGLAGGLAGPEARYEQREAVELAFIAALQHLPARQRAVLILRDVLGFSAREVGETLEMRPAAVDSALQRAHKTVDERLTQRSQQTTLRALDDDELREIANRFIDAWERTDVDSVVAMLAHDATLAMPPWPNWYSGRDAVAAFLRAVPLAPGTRWRMQPTHANGQIAFGHYAWDGPEQRFVAHGICMLTLDGALIANITNFSDPDLFAHFGLPATIEP
ncbi:MAG TPA: sigma-70 family RNA polymerase sigma factor [Chloroflexota bacterium]